MDTLALGGRKQEQAAALEHQLGRWREEVARLLAEQEQQQQAAKAERRDWRMQVAGMQEQFQQVQALMQVRHWLACLVDACEPLQQSSTQHHQCTVNCRLSTFTSQLSSVQGQRLEGNVGSPDDALFLASV